MSIQVLTFWALGSKVPPSSVVLHFHPVFEIEFNLNTAFSGRCLLCKARGHSGAVIPYLSDGYRSNSWAVFLKNSIVVVTPRLEELSRPKRFYSTYYNECRSTPIWPISRASLEAKATSRLKVLAHPKLRSNIWVVDPTKIQVSKAARMAEPRPRTLELAAPKTKSVTSSELFFINKPKQHPPDLTRIYHLAMPKVTSNNYVYDKPPSWIISQETKNAVPTSRILYLAKPRERIDCNEGHDPYCISMAAMKAEPSPRIYELAVPKRVTRKF
uniref:Theg spermatid protein n=1 Tax=Monodelphis domestica TaxID=13616 RepID=A0A5F8HCY1_MONDO